MNFKKTAIILTALLAIASCTSQEEKPPPDPVTIQLKWVHQSQFAGFYVAKEQGYYAEENLDVSFLAGGNDVDLAKSVISGQAQFGVFAPEDVMIKRSQGAPLKAIAAIYRRSAVVYLSEKNSGILRPQDFVGKTIAAAGSAGGVRDFELQFNSLIKIYGLEPSQMHMLEYDPSYKGFINGDIDVTAAYLTGGVIKLQEKGVKFNIIWPGDFGVKSYSDVFVTTDALIKEKPELVQRVLRATLKGWRTAIGNPEAAVQDVMKYAKVKDIKVQTGMMEAQIPLIHTGEHHIGWMKEDVWRAMCDRLYEQKILPTPLDVKSVFSMEFLQSVYGSDKS
ncbi:ABC transporter substrate-binding protein [Desulfatibacillum aliphaticivorans]|uniref:ABC transporter substrate-binding protein n=1 Tax=Desulfatibacillum aliphaticivorans TaxID=218208 RepID=UPI0004271206|nr:ABC transporter substrate-binding protein [Desulfatibacillum aliphaticivorans]